jgi:hypothetical protein
VAQQPEFEWSKISPADRILVIGGSLYLIDTFLPWQRACFKVFTLSACHSANAWGGNASFVGVLSALLVIALLVWCGIGLAGAKVDLGLSAGTVAALLAGGTVLFGLIKFLAVVGKSGSFGAWIGLILLLVLAYGGYLKLQEPAQGGRASGPSSAGFGS